MEVSCDVFEWVYNNQNFTDEKCDYLINRNYGIDCGYDLNYESGFSPELLQRSDQSLSLDERVESLGPLCKVARCGENNFCFPSNLIALNDLWFERYRQGRLFLPSDDEEEIIEDSGLTEVQFYELLSNPDVWGQTHLRETTADFGSKTSVDELSLELTVVDGSVGTSSDYDFDFELSDHYRFDLVVKDFENLFSQKEFFVSNFDFSSSPVAFDSSDDISKILKPFSPKNLIIKFGRNLHGNPESEIVNFDDRSQIPVEQSFISPTEKISDDWCELSQNTSQNSELNSIENDEPCSPLHNRNRRRPLSRHLYPFRLTDR